MTEEPFAHVLKALKSRRTGYRPFIIHQNFCSRRNGKVSELFFVYGTGGIIQPGSGEMRNLQPEETRQEEMIHVYSLMDMTAGKETDATHFRTADIIDPNDGTYWRVVAVKEYGSDSNCFYQALAVRTDEDPWERRKRNKEK